MNWIAWKMLTGDTAKFLGLVLGVGFAAFLMAQQVSVFMGILKRTGSQIIDISDANIWVMDPKVRFVDEAPPLPSTDLYRVRGVPGVEWAVPFFKGQARVRLEDGKFRNVMLLGLDDNTYVGAPHKMLLGNLSDLSLPVWLLVLWMLVPGTIVPFALSIAALQHLPATIVGVAATAEPPLAALVAYLWLDEGLAAAQVLGGLVVLLGIGLAQTSRPPAAT